jgi:MFS family permease
MTISIEHSDAPQNTRPAGSGGRPGLDESLYYLARLLGQTGQGLFLAGLLIAGGSGEAGSAQLSSVFAAGLAAAVLFGLPGGAAADRLGAHRGYAVGTLLRLCAIAAGAALAGSSASMWLIAFCYSAVSQVFSPSELALVIAVQRNALARTHMALQGLQYAGQGVAALLIAPLLLLGGSRLVMIAAAAVYGLMLPIVAFLSRRLARQPALRQLRTRQSLAFGETFRLLQRRQGAALAVGLLTFTDVVLRSIIVAVPRYVEEDLALDQRQIAVVIVAAGLGVIAGLVWITRRFRLSRATRAMQGTLLGMGGAVAALVLAAGAGDLVSSVSAGIPISPSVARSAAELATAVAAAAVLGFCVGIAPAMGRAVLSASAPAGHQSRVFAAQATIAHAVVIVPVLLTGAATRAAGPSPTLLTIGLCGLALLAVLSRYPSRTTGAC